MSEADRADGFRMEPRTAWVEFEGEFAGAVVEVSLDVPMELMFRFMEASQQGSELPVAEQRKAFHEFGDSVLLSWNLEDRHGVRLPANGDGLLAQPRGFAFANALLRGWTAATTGDEAPLEGPSNGGDGSVVRLTGTEAP